MQYPYDTSLLVGTTGMLFRAGEWIAQRSNRSILVSRRASQSALASRDNVIALDLDWRRPSEFLEKISSLDELRLVDLAVLWIHESGSIAGQRLMDVLSSRPCLIVQVSGSQNLSDLQMRGTPPFEMRKQARLITVFLGAQRTLGHRRWLTWDEISNGVIEAIKARESCVVGYLSE